MKLTVLQLYMHDRTIDGTTYSYIATEVHTPAYCFSVRLSTSTYYEFDSMIVNVLYSSYAWAGVLQYVRSIVQVQ